MQLVRLRIGLLLGFSVIKLVREFFTLLDAKGLLKKAASLSASASCKSLGLNLGLTLRRNDDLDKLAQAAPPTWTTSLTLPSLSDCSVTL